MRFNRTNFLSGEDTLRAVLGGLGAPPNFKQKAKESCLGPVVSGITQATLGLAASRSQLVMLGGLRGARNQTLAGYLEGKNHNPCAISPALYLELGSC